MSLGRTGFKYSINNFPVQKDYDVRINIREDLNYLRYGSFFGLQNVGISFLDSEPINIYDNLILKDLTSSIPENSPLIFSEETLSVQGFDVSNAKFLISDVFKTDSGGETTTLYFRHNLTNYPSISNVELLDGNYIPINNDLYSYFDEEVVLGFPFKSLYTNLESVFNSADRTYTIYYVRFRDDTSGEFITELLNAKPFYQSSGFSTPATKRSYTITPDINKSNVVVHFDSKTYSPTPLPNSHRFSVKTEGDNRVSVVLPPDLPPEEKWYLRINPGEFFKNTTSGDARYYVPEYSTQLFSPVPPFKLLVEKNTRIINSRLLYVEPGPIANLEADGFYLYIAIRDRFGKTIRALTNDPTAGVYSTPGGVITEIFYEKTAIKSVSEHDGFINLSTDIPEDAEAKITYRYREEFYSYRGVSVNSTINPSVLNNRIVIYIKPQFSTVLFKTIFHLLIDESDLILESSEAFSFKTIRGTAITGTLNTLIDEDLSESDIYTGFELEILSGQNAGRKLKITSYNGIAKEITVGFNYLQIIEPGVQYRINKKFKDYSHQDPETSTVFNYNGWETVYLNAPNHYILLADIFAIQTIAPDDISTSDIRIRGGGIREDQVENSLKLQDEVQWYWDIGYWDGQAYPGMGAMLVQLPREILKEVGGNFSREQVEDIVERHIGSGVYPLIRYYDKSTKIIRVQPGDQKIFIEWIDVEASSYNIYLGQNPDQMPLFRSVAGVITSFEFTELENDKAYYMMVESVVGGIAQLPSRTVFAIPFNPVTNKAPAIYGETTYSGGTYG